MSLAYDPAIYNLLQLKYALKLEIAGMTHSKGSAYAHIKRRFNFTGNRQTVYDKLVRYIDLNYPKPKQENTP